MYLLNHIVYKGFHHQWSLIEVKYKKDQGEDRASAAAAVPVIVEEVIIYRITIVDNNHTLASNIYKDLK